MAGPAAALASQVPYAGKIVEVAAPVLHSRLAEIGLANEDFAKLRNALGDRRVVVFIDDLDRAVPDAISRMFFLLREVLDLPGFSFILAFDRQRVVPVLQRAHPGFDSEEFLDKIIEFPVFLPDPTREERLALARGELAAYGSSFDEDAIAATLDLFPRSPRKLRQFMRTLRVLAPELRRHDPDELTPTVLLLVHLLAQLSSVLATLLSRDEKLNSKTIPSALMQKFEKKSDQEMRSRTRGMVEEILGKGEGDGPYDAIVDVLTALGDHRLAANATTFRYHLDLATRPHSLTNKEFRAAFAEWKPAKGASFWTNFADQHARTRVVRPRMVLREAFNAANHHRSRAMHRAADVGTAELQALEVQAARDYVLVLRQIAFDAGGATEWLTEDDVLRYWSGLGEFAHFRDAVYEDLRKEEETLAAELLRLPRLDPYRLFLALSPNRFHYDETKDRHRQQRELAEECLARLADLVIEAYAVDEGFVVLRRKWERDVTDDVMCSKASPLWRGERRTKILALIATASTNDVVFDATYHLLARLAYRGGRPEHITSDVEVVRALWRAITSRRMNRRWFGSLMSEIRPALEQAMRTAQVRDALPTPEWWDAAVAASPRPAVSGGDNGGDEDHEDNDGEDDELDS